MSERRRSTEWEVIWLRAKDERLGTAEAPDYEAALRGAVKAFEFHEREADPLLVHQCS